MARVLGSIGIIYVTSAGRDHPGLGDYILGAQKTPVKAKLKKLLNRLFFWCTRLIVFVPKLGKRGQNRFRFIQFRSFKLNVYMGEEERTCLKTATDKLLT